MKLTKIKHVFKTNNLRAAYVLRKIPFTVQLMSILQKNENIKNKLNMKITHLGASGNC